MLAYSLGEVSRSEKRATVSVCNTLQEGRVFYVSPLWPGNRIYSEKERESPVTINNGNNNYKPGPCKTHFAKSFICINSTEIQNDFRNLLLCFPVWFSFTFSSLKVSSLLFRPIQNPPIFSSCTSLIDSQEAKLSLTAGLYQPLLLVLCTWKGKMGN